MNRIHTLELDLRRGASGIQRKRRPTARPTPTPAAVEPTTPPAAGPAKPAAPVGNVVATAMNAWLGRRSVAPVSRGQSRPSRPRRSRQMTMTLDYKVPNLPMPIKQPSALLCWATVGAMMASWRDSVSYALPEYIASLGPPWKSKFDGNQGLLPAEAQHFFATMGLQTEPTQANFTAEAWEGMLRDFGPLLVVADLSANAQIQGPHAHILVGIHGPSDGDPQVDLIDPLVGQELILPMSAFIARYEQLANTPFAGMQITHWPRNAQRSAQQALAWARQASIRLSEGRTAAPVLAAAGLGWQVFKAAIETNGLTWNRAELRGTRAPGDNPDKQQLAHVAEYQAKPPIESRQTLALPDIGFTDHLGAAFEIRYRYNGHCIRDVVITNTSYAPPAPLAGRGLRVETNISGASEHERGDVAAVEVEIVYHFQNAVGSLGTYTDRTVLFGDGRKEIRSTTRN